MACMQEMRNGGRGNGPATILGIGTAVPPNCYLQSEYADFYFRVTDSQHMTQLKHKFNKICEKSMIKKRYLLHTEELLKENPNMCQFMASSLGTRQEILAKELPKLGMKAALKALEEWGHVKSKITHLIVCNTGYVQSPGLDYQLTKLLDLKPTVNRFAVNMQGCYAGGTTLRLAKDLAENNDGARVLVVCTESTLSCFRGPSEMHPNLVIDQILFGDGASALVVGSDPDGSVERPIFQIFSAAQTVISGSLMESDFYLEVQEVGLIVHLPRNIPTLIADNIEKIMVDAFEPLGIKDWNSLFWVVHPGGRAILDKIEEKLSLAEDKMVASRRVLSEYGNMIGACVHFVLEEIRRKSVKEGMGTTGEGFEWGVLLGFGPGLTIETVVLRSVRL